MSAWAVAGLVYSAAGALIAAIVYGASSPARGRLRFLLAILFVVALWWLVLLVGIKVHGRRTLDELRRPR